MIVAPGGGKETLGSVEVMTQRFPRSLLRLMLVACLAVVVAFGVAACGSDGGEGGDQKAKEYNQADVEFAQQMIGHHQQALTMVDMAKRRAPSPEFADLLADLEAAQAPEIDTMTGWLESWGEDVPDNMAGMDHGSMSPGAMSGMVTQQDLDKLDKAGARAFEDMWLQMMIGHHQSAVDLAKKEVAEGKYPDAIDLAESIATSQTEEIERMKAMLD